MKKRIGLSLAALGLCILLAVCTALSVMQQIVNFLPVAETAFTSFVTLAAPTNTNLPNEAKAIGQLLNDVDATAVAANQAGAGKTGVQKVIAELTPVIQQIQVFESDLTSAGAAIPSNDEKFIAGGAEIVLTALEGYEAVLQSQAGATATTTAQLVDVHGECFGFESNGGHGPYHVWANCDPDYAIDVTEEQTAQTTVIKSNGKKPASIANWKRQYNALARKYGHPERQLNLSTRDHIVHVLTFGAR